MPVLTIGLIQETMGYVTVQWTGSLPINCTDSPCNYDPGPPTGAMVTLTAHPNTGYHFVSWADTYGGTYINCPNPTCNFLMPPVNLGVNCTFEANAPQQPTATCSWWWSGGTGNPMQGCTLKATITWNNATPRSGNCAAVEEWAPGAGGPCDLSGSTQTSGSIELFCVASIGGYWIAKAFLWNGTSWVEFSYEMGSGPSWRINVQGSYTLTLHNAPVGGGGIIFGGNECIAATCNYNLAPNTRVILSAYTNPGYYWAGWTGDTAGCSALDCDFYMTQNRNITATFISSSPVGTAITCAENCTPLQSCPPVTTFNSGDDISAWLTWGTGHDYYSEQAGYRWMHNGEIYSEYIFNITTHGDGLVYCLGPALDLPVGTGYIEVLWALAGYIPQVIGTSDVYTILAPMIDDTTVYLPGPAPENSPFVIIGPLVIRNIDTTTRRLNWKTWWRYSPSDSWIAYQNGGPNNNVTGRSGNILPGGTYTVPSITAMSPPATVNPDSLWYLGVGVWKAGESEPGEPSLIFDI